MDEAGSAVATFQLLLEFSVCHLKCFVFVKKGLDVVLVVQIQILGLA